ncbi:tetraspanin 16 [Phyllostomus discolor]|uniref:Tetraspanin 16 n=1 Tax=Phyllostomus discolor TaxID=89673 RepID=A0A834DZ20_9CHIR|nr:tetraspanin 16 [Phyllostomus discolor]
MAENHTYCSFLKKLSIFLNGFIAYFLFMAVIITAESVIATVVLVFLPTVQQQTLEHSSAALKKSYRGYCEPDDYSMDWNLVMEKVLSLCVRPGTGPLHQSSTLLASEDILTLKLYRQTDPGRG